MEFPRASDQTLRAITIDGTPWFVAADVCRILGIANNGNAYKRLGAAEVSNIRRADVGEAPGRDMRIVTESGLYKLIMRSDKPEARTFQDWVTREVLPSIRETGAQRLSPTFGGRAPESVT